MLVVDEDGVVRAGLRRLLEGDGFQVDTVVSGEEALRRNHRFAADVIIIDSDRPGISASRRRAGWSTTRRRRPW